MPNSQDFLDGHFQNKIGRRGEDAAADALRRLGYKIHSRNWITSLGEIDIVCSEGAELVIVEVKSRREYYPKLSSRLFDNITMSKKKKLRRLAELYMLKSRLVEQFKSVRIDVIGVMFDPDTLQVKQIQHFKGAV
jgi:putative endonuclease